jgi:hypothetical protein
VAGGGEINGDGMGYGNDTQNASGYGPGLGSSAGNRGGGAGHGGVGGMGQAGGANGGATYGSAANPTNPGSGGGGGWASKGGAGGGYVKILASNSVTVDGLISLNGNNGESWSGAGAGGGIYIQCGSLTGSGTIRANGGNGGGESGGGGGGRIAIFATNVSTSFNGQVSAGAGTSCYNFPNYDRYHPLPGTVYLSDWGILPALLTNGGAGRFTAPTGLAASVTISNYTLFLDWGWETNRLRAGVVTVRNGGAILHCHNTASAAPWTPEAGIFIECADLTVESGGRISGEGMGYVGGAVGGNGYGPGYGTSSGDRGGGGGHGGKGRLWVFLRFHWRRIVWHAGQPDQSRQRRGWRIFVSRRGRRGLCEDCGLQCGDG